MNHHVFMKLAAEGGIPEPLHRTEIRSAKSPVIATPPPAMNAIVQRLSLAVRYTQECQLHDTIWSVEKVESGLSRVFWPVLHQLERIPKKYVNAISPDPMAEKVRTERSGAVGLLPVLAPQTECAQQ